LWFVADQINEQLTATVNQSRCPCSRYSCLRHDDGYKIGIALMKKMKHGKAFDEWDAQEQSEKFVYFGLFLCFHPST